MPGPGGDAVLWVAPGAGWNGGGGGRQLRQRCRKRHHKRCVRKGCRMWVRRSPGRMIFPYNSRQRAPARAAWREQPLGSRGRDRAPAKRHRSGGHTDSAPRTEDDSRGGPIWSDARWSLWSVTPSRARGRAVQYDLMHLPSGRNGRRGRSGRVSRDDFTRLAGPELKKQGGDTTCVGAHVRPRGLREGSYRIEQENSSQRGLPHPHHRISRLQYG